MNTPAIFVGTYAKYNSGSNYGAWVDLTEFGSIAEFCEYCGKLHEDEDEPEFMFQDYEYIPEGYISECHLNPAIFDVLEEIRDSKDYEDFCNFVSHFGKDATVERFREAFIGHYDSEIDFAYELVEQTTTKDVSEFFLRYFDYKAYARDLFLDGYVFIDGIVYYSC
jgi:antirestriction protein